MLMIRTQSRHNTWTNGAGQGLKGEAKRKGVISSNKADGLSIGVGFLGTDYSP